MPRQKGSKDKKERAAGSGGAREGSGGAREGSGGAREGSGGAREGAGAPLGCSNRILPTTASKKLVDEGMRLYRDDKYEDALELFVKAAAVDPNNGEAFYMIADLRWKILFRKQKSMSQSEYDTCLSFAKESHRLGFEDALEQYNVMRSLRTVVDGQEILVADLPELLDYYKTKSTKLSLELSKMPPTKSKFPLVSPEAVEASNAYFAYGNLFIQTREPAAAAHQFEKSLALNPENWRALGNIAMAFLSLGRYGPAAECAKACLRLRPGSKQATDVLKGAEHNISEEFAMVKMLIDGTVGQGVESIVKLDFGGLGVVEFHSPMWKEDDPTIVKVYKSRSERESLEFAASSLLPKTPFGLTVTELSTTHFYLGMLYAELEDYDAALAAYEVSLRLVPENVIAKQKKEVSWGNRWYSKAPPMLTFSDFMIYDPYMFSDCPCNEALCLYISEHPLREHFKEVVDREYLEMLAYQQRHARPSDSEDDEEWEDCDENEEEEFNAGSGEECSASERMVDDPADAAADVYFASEEMADEWAGAASEDDEEWEDCEESEVSEKRPSTTEDVASE
jgi:tetratricopeptide (TPR) repeat protein